MSNLKPSGTDDGIGNVKLPLPTPKEYKTHIDRKFN